MVARYPPAPKDAPAAEAEVRYAALDTKGHNFVAYGG